MKINFTIAILLGLCLQAAPGVAQVENVGGFKSLFNGHDLSGWTGAVEDYEVRDGAIVCKPGMGGVLFTEQEFEDFVIRLEFNVPPGGNNGLAIRYPGQGRASYDGMCELQVLDDSAEKYAELDPRQYHGSVYGIAPAHRGYLRPSGQWNYQEVTVQGSKIKVELNGSFIVDVDVSQIKEFKDNTPHPGIGLARGHFGLAGHNDPVMFRNVAVKELPKNKPSGVTTIPRQNATVQEVTSRDDSAFGRARRAMILHASFDDVVDLNLFDKDGWMYTATSTKRDDPRQGMHTNDVVIAKGKGKYGDALEFKRKSDEVLFYQGSESGYRQKDWQGTLSVWLKLNPDEDLEPGFCDPIQITQRGWNDGAFFVDFDKDLPRDFRLGVFPDYKFWNPSDTKFEEIPSEERPMITVKKPPFARDRWTHVCFTWKNVNASDDSPGTAKLYLDGELQGSMTRPMQFTWDLDDVGIMLGIHYVGLMDDLIIFRSALDAEQITAIHGNPVGGLN